MGKEKIVAGAAGQADKTIIAAAGQAYKPTKTDISGVINVLGAANDYIKVKNKIVSAFIENEPAAITEMDIPIEGRSEGNVAYFAEGKERYNEALKNIALYPAGSTKYKEAIEITSQITKGFAKNKADLDMLNKVLVPGIFDAYSKSGMSAQNDLGNQDFWGEVALNKGEINEQITFTADGIMIGDVPIRDLMSPITLEGGKAVVTGVGGITDIVRKIKSGGGTLDAQDNQRINENLSTLLGSGEGGVGYTGIKSAGFDMRWLTDDGSEVFFLRKFLEDAGSTESLIDDNILGGKDVSELTDSQIVELMKVGWNYENHDFITQELKTFLKEDVIQFAFDSEEVAKKNGGNGRTKPTLSSAQIGLLNHATETPNGFTVGGNSVAKWTGNGFEIIKGGEVQYGGATLTDVLALMGKNLSDFTKSQQKYLKETYGAPVVNVVNSPVINEVAEIPETITDPRSKSEYKVVNGVWMIKDRSGNWEVARNKATIRALVKSLGYSPSDFINN